MKICTRCGKQSKLENFSKTSHVNQNGERGRRGYCKDCEHEMRRGHYKIHRAKIRNRAKKLYNGDEKYREKRRCEGLRQNYGISLAVYQKMHADQKGRCSICGKHENDLQKPRLYVDHDHETDEVRSLLCNLCNVGLGAFGDDPTILLLAYDYLNKHKK